VPYGWGCVLSNVRRKQVEGTDFAEVFPDFKTLLRDDLSEELDPYEFEKRLWGMYAGWTPQALTLPQRDRVRWHLFPEVRVQQASLFEAQEQTAPTLALPDLMQVMDLQQEQVARTLGEGHRVIHGPAGSGKTMILIFRAQQLAAAAAPERPILVLCFNRILAQRIEGSLRQRGVDERCRCAPSTAGARTWCAPTSSTCRSIWRVMPTLLRWPKRWSVPWRAAWCRAGNTWRC